MMKVISPHLDDAILSLGQFLAATPGTVVVTVCAGLPAKDVLTDYDRATGALSSRNAMTLRRQEDAEACAEVGALPRWLDFLDGQYPRAGYGYAPTLPMAEAIRVHLPPNEHVFAPLGIGHPDHLLVARACREAAYDELLLYEELPYRVLWPEQVFQALDEVESEGWRLDPLPWPTPAGDRAVKERAIAKYRSQFPAGADNPCLLVPERVWRATRCD